MSKVLRVYVRKMWTSSIPVICSLDQTTNLKNTNVNSYIVIFCTRNPASRASKHARLVAMYIAVAIKPSS